MNPGANRVCELNLRSPHWIRGGIIPVLDTPTGRLYGFGIDSDYGTLIDFGGHRESFDYDILDTARRELSEESFDVFGKPSRSELLKLPVLYNDTDMEILWLINSNRSPNVSNSTNVNNRSQQYHPQHPHHLQSEFRKLVDYHLQYDDKKVENTDLIWLTYDQIKRTSPQSMYPRLWKLLFYGNV